MVTVTQALAGDNAVTTTEAFDLLTEARRRAFQNRQSVESALTGMLQEYSAATPGSRIDEPATAKVLLTSFGDGALGTVDRVEVITRAPASPTVPAKAVRLDPAPQSPPAEITVPLEQARARFQDATQTLLIASKKLSTSNPTVTATIHRTVKAMSTELAGGVQGSQRVGTEPNLPANTPPPVTTGNITVTNYPGILPYAPDYLSENGTTAFKNRLENAATRVEVPNGLPQAPLIVQYRAALIEYMDAVRQYAQATAIAGMYRTGRGIQALQGLGIVQATPQGVFTQQQAIEQINAEIAALTTLAQGQSMVVDLAQGVVRAVVGAANTGLSAAAPQDPLPNLPK